MTWECILCGNINSDKRKNCLKRGAQKEDVTNNMAKTAFNFKWKSKMR